LRGILPPSIVYLLNWAKLSEALRKWLYAQCAELTTCLENKNVDKATDKYAADTFYGKNPHWIKNLRTFGEIAIVSDHARRNVVGKIDHWGNACIFVGYYDSLAKDCYNSMTINTNGMIYSRDAIWLNEMYGDYIGADRVKILPSTNRYVMNEDFSDIDRGYEEKVQTVDGLGDD
jgi:hypothetical protein